jgi:cytoskeletal protein CcmA (bactofilin family)
VCIDGKINGAIDVLSVLTGRTEAEVVVGDIKTNILTIAEGAYFDGNSSMITKEIDGRAGKK